MALELGTEVALFIADVRRKEGNVTSGLHRKLAILNVVFCLCFGSGLLGCHNVLGTDMDDTDMDEPDGGTIGDGGPTSEGNPGQEHWAVFYDNPYAAAGYYLDIRNQAFGCDDYDELITCILEHTTWSITMQIPEDKMTVGLHPLNSLIYPSASVTGPNGNDLQDCWWGAGDFLQGSLEILDIEEQKMTVSFENTETIEFNVNGIEIEVQYCPL